MSGTKLSPLALEQLALGVHPAQAEWMADPSVRAQVEALQAENDALLADRPPRVAAAVIGERQARAEQEAASNSASGRWWRWAPALVVAGAAAVFLLPSADETRTKGAALLRLEVRVDDQATAPHVPAPAGAAVVPHVTLDDRGFALLLSVDGRGQVTLHPPLDGTAPVGPGPIEGQTFILDDAPAFEQFVLCSQKTPFDRERQLAQARRLARQAPGRPLPDDAVRALCGQGARAQHARIAR